MPDPIGADDFERMWADLRPIGRSEATGGYFRTPFDSAERECVAWFREQCAARQLELQEDQFGNLVAWWRPLDVDGGAVLTGSHLDSVLNGGAYDGPLGVVSALAAVDVLRERGVTLARPIGVSVFVAEEGSRFGLACLGSRLATGSTPWEQARELRDRDGVSLADAMAAAGLSPDAAADAHSLLAGVDCYVELHVEQGRDLVDRDEPVGVASAIWPHGRYRFDFTGEANHAGATKMVDRHDPMLSFAATALAAAEQARRAEARATFGRLAVQPNGTNAVPEEVTAWLDARAESEAALDALVDAISQRATERVREDGTDVAVTAESVSPAVVFEAGLAARLAAAGRTGREWPVIPTGAGHDAGVTSGAGLPSGMLFVRNPTGVSHSPAEHAETTDCLAGVAALADALADLAGTPA